MTAAGERLVTRPFVLLVAAGLAFFTAGGAVLPVASQFAEGPLDATTTGVGIAIGAFAIGSLVLRPVVGWGSDRFGRRPMLVFGALLSVFGLALHLFVDSLPMFVVARIVLGAAEAFFFVALLAAARTAGAVSGTRSDSRAAMPVSPMQTTQTAWKPLTSRTVSPIGGPRARPM